MPGENINDILKQPDHYLHAAAFIADILSVKDAFPDLEITAVNQTQQDSWFSISEEDEISDAETRRQMLRQSDEEDRKSASQTHVSVSIRGDDKKRIAKAARMIDQSAQKHKRAVKVSKTDHDTTENLLRKIVSKIAKHQPQSEDEPLFTRFIDYYFEQLG